MTLKKTIELGLYVIGLYLCLVWAKWLPKPFWLQEDIEPVYAILGAMTIILNFLYQQSKESSFSHSMKNIVRFNWINASGNVHIGDINKSSNKENEHTEVRVVEKNIIKSKDLHIGNKNE